MRKKQTRGQSLIELLLVVLAVGIFALVLASALGGLIGDGASRTGYRLSQPPARTSEGLR